VALGIGVMALLAGSVAAYPVLLRVNAGWDDDGLHLVAYKHKQSFEYQAMDVAMEVQWPDIEVPSRVHWNNPSVSKPLIVLFVRALWVSIKPILVSCGRKNRGRWTPFTFLVLKCL
jgi:hypothetical protein